MAAIINLDKPNDQMQFIFSGINRNAAIPPPIIGAHDLGMRAREITPPKGSHNLGGRDLEWRGDAMLKDFLSAKITKRWPGIRMGDATKIRNILESNLVLGVFFTTLNLVPLENGLPPRRVLEQKDEANCLESHLGALQEWSEMQSDVVERNRIQTSIHQFLWILYSPAVFTTLDTLVRHFFGKYQIPYVVEPASWVSPIIAPPPPPPVNVPIPAPAIPTVQIAAVASLVAVPVPASTVAPNNGPVGGRKRKFSEVEDEEVERGNNHRRGEMGVHLRAVRGLRRR